MSDTRQQAIEALRDKFPIASDGAWLVEEVDRLHRRSQGFFEALAAETRKPHYGGAQREWAQQILIRAQEAHLYTPEQS